MAGRKGRTAKTGTREVARTRAGKQGPNAGAAAAAPAVKPGLERIRVRIDDIDAQLHQLINQRAELAKQVGIS
jgi:hypothetical protein